MPCRPDRPCGGVLVEDTEYYAMASRFGGPRMLRCYGSGHTYMIPPTPTPEPPRSPVVWRSCSRCGEPIIGVPIQRKGSGRRLHDVCTVVSNGGARYCVICRRRLPEGGDRTVCAGPCAY